MAWVAGSFEASSSSASNSRSNDSASSTGGGASITTASSAFLAFSNRSFSSKARKRSWHAWRCLALPSAMWSQPLHPKVFPKRITLSKVTYVLLDLPGVGGAPSSNGSAIFGNSPDPPSSFDCSARNNGKMNSSGTTISDAWICNGLPKPFVFILRLS